MSGCGCDQTGLRPVDQAIADLLALAPKPPQASLVSLSQAHGRVLAEPILARMPMPAWDNSAMDGYALRANDVPKEGGFLPLSGRITAGDAAQVALPPGHAVRIFTGAPLPPGADTVVPQERVRVEGEFVWFPPCSVGDHVRVCGEEFGKGTCVLEAGQVLLAPQLGLLASLGFAEVLVHRRLRVGLFSSGNELCDPGKALRPGQIYNGNRYSLTSALTSWGMQVEDCGVLVDELINSREALTLAASEWDLLITSGGVSVGEEDHIKQAVTELGYVNLWRLAIQPGKPFAFGHVRGTPWIGLPGNPVAALLTLMVVARPYLLAAQGRSKVLPTAMPVAAGFTWVKANGRRQYLRARLQGGENGLQVVLSDRQGSAMLTSMCWAQGLAVVEANRTVEEGEPVGFLSFAELLGSV